VTEAFEDDLPQVAASEADLIATARALIAPQAFDVWAVLCRSRKLPPHFGETCAALLEDSLRQVWPALLRRGGTAPDRSGKRLWERHPLVALPHSAATARFLRWLTTTPFAAPPSAIETLPAMPLTLGDQVLVYLALDVAAGTPAQHTLAVQPFVRDAPLAWLGFAHLFDLAPAESMFDNLVHGPGAVVVEALAPEIARRWQAAELTKRALTSPTSLVNLGRAQDGTLRAFMAACDRRRRRDLALFVLDAAAPLLARDIAPMPPRLDPAAPLSVRTAARTGAGSLLRGVIRWSEWDQEHRGVRFIDDDYALAQQLLAKFERIGSAGVERTAQWLSELSALA